MQNLVARNDHFDWRINLLGISAAMPPAVRLSRARCCGVRFDGPVTVHRAASTPTTSRRRDGADFGPMFSQVELEVIAEAGHWVHADQPAALPGRVRRALQARDARPVVAPRH